MSEATDMDLTMFAENGTDGRLGFETDKDLNSYLESIMNEFEMPKSVTG